MKNGNKEYIIITAGSTYLDIDAYACCVALAELLALKGENAVAWSPASGNYSVCASLTEEGQIRRELPAGCCPEKARYIIVDVSDPDYLKDSVPLAQVAGIYDHHPGFESYWQERIGEDSHIESIGAAATLIFREWKKAGLTHRMKPSTAKLLIAAVLDNTLDLTSSNTTREDREAFEELCRIADVADDWRAVYFSEVQACVEADLRNALLHDIKTLRGNAVLPPVVAQLCVWDADSILCKLPRIRQWLCEFSEGWMLNIIDIQHRCSYFICDDAQYQNRIEQVFDVRFQAGVARTAAPYLRKQIIKKTL